jgi:hypothetical protein
MCIDYFSVSKFDWRAVRDEIGEVVTLITYRERCTRVDNKYR